jgi:hypothetical protein
LDKFVALDDASVELVRDTAGNHQDFLRLLPAACQGHPHETLETGAHIDLGAGKGVRIELGPVRVRRIGPTVALPTTPVRYVFRGMNPTEIEKFLSAFDRYFQRGGG